MCNGQFLKIKTMMDETEFEGSINKFKTDITTNNNNKKQNRQIRSYASVVDLQIPYLVKVYQSVSVMRIMRLCLVLYVHSPSCQSNYSD